MRSLRSRENDNLGSGAPPISARASGSMSLDFSLGRDSSSKRCQIGGPISFNVMRASASVLMLLPSCMAARISS